MAKAKHIFVIDTCVLLHDPECIYRFQEHDIYIPLAVIDDLDEIKTKKDNAGWAAREVFRNLDQYDIQLMTKGIVINEFGGKLFIYNNEAPLMRNEKPTITRVNSDNAIIDSATTLKAANQKRKVVIVTKDTGLRARAISWGCTAENYKSDLLSEQNQYQGYRIVEIDSLEDWDYLNKRTECVVSKLACKEQLNDINPNEFICFRWGNQSIPCWFTNNEIIFLEDKKKASYMGITAKNLEQRFALEALANDNIPFVCLSGPAGSGKAQPLDSMILTPDGYIRMGDVTVGTKVCGSDGNFHNVTGVFPQGVKDVVKIIFSDGSEVECCKEHLWNTSTNGQRNYQNAKFTTKTTEEIMKTIKSGSTQRRNHKIPIVKPIAFEYKETLVDPYLLGCLIGDGCFQKEAVSFITGDSEMITSLSSVLPGSLSFKPRGVRGINFGITRKSNSPEKNNVLKAALKQLGLDEIKAGNKFVPDVFLFNSAEVRLSVLQGLLDTDGYISIRGTDIIFTTISEKLAKNVEFLVQSLGGVCKTQKKQKQYTYKNIKKNGQPSYDVRIILPNETVPFRLERKKNRLRNRTQKLPSRFIEEIIEIGQKECQCISVDAPDHLYVTDNFILTHNTLCAIAVGLEKVNMGQYDRIIVMKPMVAVGGQGIGFLPGSKLEKVSAWLGPIKDNIIQLTGVKGYETGKFGGNSFEEMVDDGIIEVEAMAFIQGRSIPDSYIILDEAENVSPKEARMVVERCGKGSKVVFLGDMSQIENPYLDKHSCGLAHAINGAKTQEVAASITMHKVERSILSAAASSIFRVRK
jgi:predicted ribonuclease YlaK